MSHKYLQRWALGLAGVAVAVTVALGLLLWLRLSILSGEGLPPLLRWLDDQVNALGIEALSLAVLRLAFDDRCFFLALGAELATVTTSSAGAVWLAWRASTCSGIQGEGERRL